MPQPRRPRVLLADDNAQVGVAITRLLSFSCDVVGCVPDIDTLLETVALLRPEVVLLDFSLPGRLNALEVCRLMKATTPQVAIVAFTAHDDPDIKRLAYEAGASGFVWKPKAATDLVPAIHAVIDRASREP